MISGKELDMKKRTFISFLFLCAAVAVINSETNFFLDIGDYIPALKEKAPKIVSVVSKASENLSYITDMIPSPAEIIAFIKHEELPIDPSDIAVNAYITDSPMLSFYPSENAGAVIENNKLKIFGIIKEKEKQHLVINLTDLNENTITQTTAAANKDGEFSKTISLPSSGDSNLRLDIYTGAKAYGDFESWVYNYLYLERTNGEWRIKESPVYAHNKTMYEADKSVSEALKNNSFIQSNSNAVKETAVRITADCTSDYEKVLAVHDWVCSNIYYDTDNINSTQTLPYSATEVLESKRAVCLGFAVLSASLLRSINIPCNVVSGYALGIDADKVWSESTVNTTEQNHAWNEAYVDGRWVIFDSTWDCMNKIENGETVSGKSVTHIYFDANIEFFSANHKIIDYMKRR